MRITKEERSRFHKIVDDSINKMNSPKNADKEHWSLLSTNKLERMINVESSELSLAISDFNTDSVETECFDIINCSLFIADNLRGNK